MTPFSPPRKDITQSDFKNIERYWNDADYRKRVDAEVAHNRKLTNDIITAGLEKYRAKKAAMKGNDDD